MSVPSVLERCRMALAEIGVDPHVAVPGTSADTVHISAVSCTRETAWMVASTVSWPDAVICWPCHDEAASAAEAAWPDFERMQDAVDAGWDGCQAWRPFQRESCGAHL